MKIRDLLIMSFFFVSVHGMAATTCTSSGQQVTGILTAYGIDSGGLYSYIKIKEKTSGTISSLTNTSYPLSTPSGQAIDKTLSLAYTSGLPVVIYCTGNGVFASVQISSIGY